MTPLPLLLVFGKENLRDILFPELLTEKKGEGWREEKPILVGKPKGAHMCQPTVALEL